MKRKLIKFITKVILIVGVAISIFIPQGAKAMDNKKILIYHSHTAEAYRGNYNVVKAGEDLSNKLRAKGFTVKHITDKFDADYNRSYYESRKMLKSKNLDEYSLIIDYHRDSIKEENRIVEKDKNGNDIAKPMFVLTKENKNYSGQLRNVKILESSLNARSASGKTCRSTWEYNKGITYYSQDLSENVILLENGFQNNDELEIKRTNTYIASSIENLLK